MSKNFNHPCDGFDRDGILQNKNVVKKIAAAKSYYLKLKSLLQTHSFNDFVIVAIKHVFN